MPPICLGGIDVVIRCTVMRGYTGMLVEGSGGSGSGGGFPSCSSG